MSGTLAAASGTRQTGSVTNRDIVSVTRTVAAPAQDIFDLLATPVRHAEIDGSGSVRGVQPRTPQRLSAGTRFGMQMRIGLPYKILNEVVEFDEPSRIAWRHFGGHVWRYLLAPVDDQHTRVTEQFDATGSRAPFVLSLIGARRRNEKAINATLARLQRWARVRR
jgi:Polyketide cyclase / dehydrase and lipid transport